MVKKKINKKKLRLKLENKKLIKKIKTKKINCDKPWSKNAMNFVSKKLI